MPFQNTCLIWSTKVANKTAKNFLFHEFWNLKNSQFHSMDSWCTTNAKNVCKNDSSWFWNSFFFITTDWYLLSLSPSTILTQSIESHWLFSMQQNPNGPKMPETDIILEMPRYLNSFFSNSTCFICQLNIQSIAFCLKQKIRFSKSWNSFFASELEFSVAKSGKSAFETNYLDFPCHPPRKLQFRLSLSTSQLTDSYY